MSENDTKEVEQEVQEENSQHDESVTSGAENAAAPKEADDDNGDFDIDDLIADERDDEEDSPKVEEPKEEEPKQEEKPVEEEKKEEPPKQEEPPKKEEEPARQETPQTPAEPSKTPEEISAAYKEFFDKSVDVLADNVYVFDDETKEALDTNPSQVLPKLAAQMHMQVLSAALTQFANLFPMMLSEHQGKAKAYEEAEEGFYKEYPMLREHRQTVDRVAQVYAQMNPGVKDRKQAASEIAAMAMVQARVQFPQAQSEPPAAKPVIPTSARGAAPSAPASRPSNEWEELVSDED